jgi:hypothetical protein
MNMRPVITAGLLQGAGIAIAISALNKTAFATLDQKLHPEGGAIFNLFRLYGSMLGIAIVQICFYSNLQAMHLALAKDLAPYRAAAHLAGALPRPGLAKVNEMITGQAGVVAILGQFKILLFAMLVASPLVLFLRKPRPAGEVRAVRETSSPMTLLAGRAALTIVIAMAALAFLPGCTVGPNFTRPAAPESKQYDQPAEQQLSATNGVAGAPRIGLGQKIKGDWWSAFGSAKLDQVMHRAIDGNLDLAAADATIAQANEAVIGAKGGLYPQIDYDAQIGRERSDNGGFAPPTKASYYTAGLVAS